MMTEMVSRADGSLQNLFGLQDISETIYEFGSPEQKNRYLPGFASGEYDGSMDLTEPDSGSDLQSVRLKATQDPETGQWYLNGMKRFITNGCARVHLVLARTEEGSTDGRGLSMFICEKCPELVVRRIEHKHGIHGVATCELQYNNVPAELCGLRKRGLTKYVMSLMNGARIAISGQALGIAEAAYYEAKKYAAEREQFKQSIDKFPAVYDMLTSMKVKIIAARTLLYETTRIVDLKGCYTQKIESMNVADVSKEDKDKLKMYTKLAAVLTPMSKAYCTEIGNQVCYDGLQIHGGTGYMHDFNAERFSRDVRITNIYEGTTQLQIVAAVGGVIQRVLDPVIEKLAAGMQEQHGVLARLLNKLNDMHSRFKDAVTHVRERKDPEYQNLMARALVEMETIIFIGYLMVRDASKDPSREAIAEIFIFNNLPVFEAALLRVNADSGDTSNVVIDKHREVIDY
jgi:alkylation response protein AidB-like acyl-CoA dehydrogenase